MMKLKKRMLISLAALAASTLISAPPARAEESAASTEQANEVLAKKLANPISNLISAPLQLNYDANIGPDTGGSRWTLNVQPVIPFQVSQNLTIISRTILPIMFQDHLFPGAGYQSGIGDILQSVFFSPTLEDQSLTVGGGPVFLIPTATDNLLGAGKWGAGPTAVVVKLSGPWTYGALANHVWSFAGSSDRTSVSKTFFQPFLVYTTHSAWSYSISSETTYDWIDKEAAIPLNFVITKLTKIGNQRVSIGGGLRYWAKSTDNGPEGLGFRGVFTMLFPK
jgi:hypothetical protein